MLSVVSPFVNVGNFCGARIRERDQPIDLFLMVIRKPFMWQANNKNRTRKHFNLLVLALEITLID